ncbi:DUF4034 domain-containing protein [Methylocystis parvus]|uniref:DUF4034 domain-containing protein n=1 Tax=Methylocystis parvus TaxID=134 RepID=UPI003C70F1FA
MAFKDGAYQPVEIDPTLAEHDAEGRPFWWDGSALDALEELPSLLFVTEKFDDLDRLLDDWTKQEARAADGRWLLTTFPKALDAQFKWRDGWARELDRINRWKAKSPKSVGAALAEAEYWLDYSLNARGAGYSDSVDKDGWRLFHERAQKAQQALLASESYASDNPLWGLIYLQASPGLGWSHAEQMRLYRKLIAKHKNFYGYYFAMAQYFLPRWGGDWRLVELIAREAEENNKDREGAGMYARVYWRASVYGGLDVNVFRDTPADWTHMREGFEKIMSDFPYSAWNLNAYAMFACRAGDRPTFARLRKRIGDATEPDAWPTSLSLDLCEHKFPVGKQASPVEPTDGPIDGREPAPQRRGP